MPQDGGALDTRNVVSLEEPNRARYTLQWSASGAWLRNARQARREAGTGDDKEEGMSDRDPVAAIDPREVDRLYKPFPPFSDWAKCWVDEDRWGTCTAAHSNWRQVDAETLRRARKIVSRAAAIESGAIEGLYEVDRGFTFTVAAETAMWELALSSKGDRARSLIEHQLQVYERVLDLATQRVPIAEAWVRELHRELCEPQKTYLVQTEVGPQEQSLPIGEYKSLPNHVRQPDGTLHAYAPVDLTSSEMGRLCAELRSELFANAHPILQSSYAHYALVAVHPFADGNGRVARALGSVYTYRAESVPILIFAENRREYYRALSGADAGDYHRFVDFTLDRCVATIELLDESIRAAQVPEVSDLARGIKGLYLTGGYTHAQVDGAAQALLEAFKAGFAGIQRELKEDVGELEMKFGMRNVDHTPARPTSRLPVIGGSNMIALDLRASAPAEAQFVCTFGVEVPKDCQEDDYVLVADANGEEVFSASLSDLIPEPSVSVQMRVNICARRVLSQALAELRSKAEESVRTKG